MNAVAAFRPGGELLASADADGTVRLWNTATRQAPARLHPGRYGRPLRREGGGVSPGGKLLASADANGTVRQWNPATGQAIGPTLPAESKQVPGVRNVPFGPRP